MMNARFLPTGWSPAEINRTIGLVADTHFPVRGEALPPTLFSALAGVDLILHGGDVGELRVLDQLSTIAPVIAVHGNDDTAEAQRELPYQQIVTVGGRRILLWHSHYPERQAELASRVDDALLPKLGRSVERAQRAGATIVVFGHWHIPLTYLQDDVLVINPGALASGGFLDRQLHKTLALLCLAHDGRVAVVHVNLTPPPQPFVPQIDWQGGFKAALGQFSASILEPEMEIVIQRLRTNLSPSARQAIIGIVLPWAQRCWRGEQERITLAQFRQGLLTNSALDQAIKDEVAALLGRAG
jgi:uncharacterized protein